eukprot:14245-Heterococcus_DN1.PRE.4
MLKCTRNVSALLCWRLVHALSAKGLATASVRDALFGHRSFIATSERSKSSDTELWSTGAFTCVVVPDLPPVQKLSTLNDWKKLLQAYTCQQQYVPATTDGILTVRSVAAQLYGRKQVLPYKRLCFGKAYNARSLWLMQSCTLRTQYAHAFLGIAAHMQVRARLAAAAGVDSSGRCLLNAADSSGIISTRLEQQQQLQPQLQQQRPQQAPHALLLLSGSHPLRALWWLRRMDAVAQIKLATEMKRTGHLPNSVALWAVVNPVAADQDTELKRCVTYCRQYCPMCTPISDATRYYAAIGNLCFAFFIHCEHMVLYNAAQHIHAGYS